MLVVSIFIDVVVTGIYWILWFYMWLIIGAAVLSWVNPDPANPIVRFIHNTTDPILMPVRKHLAPLTFKINLDFSPIAAILVIVFLQRVIQVVVLPFAASLR